MVDSIKCPGCAAKLRVRPEFAGKRIKCPRCKTAISIPAGIAKEVKAVPADVEPEPEEQVTAQKPKKKLRVPVIEDQPDDVAEGDDLEDAPAFKPCPRCGGKRPKRVTWTAWGSFYGPALFNHVRCRRSAGTA